MVTSENKKIFAYNLRYYMNLYEKDRKQICQELNIKYSTLTEWYNGIKYPRIDKIEKLANYFHIKKSDLIESHPPTKQKETNTIKLLQIRQGNNLTLEQLSDAIHIPKETLEQYETGKAIPSTKTLLKICEYLHISADYLLGLSDDIQIQSGIINNNGAIVSNSNLRHSNINVNSNELTAYAKELIDIYKNLDSRNQIKLLSYAFELENQK